MTRSQRVQRSQCLQVGSGRSLVASDPRNLDFSEYAIPDSAEPADPADSDPLTLAVPTAFRNTRNAALGRARDGEGRASAVEPIFGDLIKSLHMKALTKLLAKMPAGRGRGERKPIIQK